MRVLEIADVRWFNACAHYALAVSRALAEAGHDVTLVANPDTPIVKRARKAGLDVVTQMDFSTPVNHIDNIIRLRRLIRERKIEIVNGHRGESHFPAAMAAHMEGIPFVRTRGDVRPPRGHVFTKFQLRRLTDGVISTMKSHVDRYGELLPLLPVAYIPLGIELPLPLSPKKRDEIRQGWGVGDDSFVFIFVARFSEIKGHDTLFKALEGMNDHRIHILLVGYEQGIPREEFEMMVPEGISCSIVDDRVDNIMEWMQASNAGLVLSKGSEAISRTLLEYMAAGLPVAATTVGQIPEVMEDAGFAIPPDSVTETRKALTAILNNEDLRKKLSQRALARASAMSLTHFAEQTAQFYETVKKRK